jgi:hypothetical protein
VWRGGGPWVRLQLPRALRERFKVSLHPFASPLPPSALCHPAGYGSEAGAASIGLSRDRLASFVLKIETEELGITAGLQDRVVQAYEGLVHMDFTLPVLKAHDGMGVYTRLSASALPPLFLAYAADPSDSGRIHAPVKQRWLAGDKEVVDGMNRIAALADDALALCTREWRANERAAWRG